MSINACTINNTTIDAICGNRRAAIITTLIGALPQKQSGKGHVQVNPPRRYINRELEHEYETTDIEMEQSNINVAITINGETYSQTLPNNQIIPLITISKIAFSNSIESVNITDISFRILE